MSWIKGLTLKALAWFFRSVRLPPSLEAIVKDNKPFVLISQSNSLVVEGLLLSFAKRLKLKGVRRFNAGDSLPDQTSFLAWACMHDETNITALSRLEPPCLISTLNIFHIRGPVRNPPQHRPGIIWVLSTLLARRILYVVCGNPMHLPHVSFPRLLRLLKVDFYRNLKIVRGTPLQSLETQQQIILSGQEFERELRILSERAGNPLWLMRRRALSSFKDMAANPKRPWYAIIGWLAEFITKRLFNEVMTKGLERLVPAVRDHPVVLVPMHRSHFDYILVGNQLYHSKVNPPIVAAGINLRFWPIGYLIRSVGGFFVKRNARDRLHSLLLKRYLLYLIKRGHLLEFFIEGSRSRSGKMLQPKLGLLSVLLEAYQRGIRKEILFVPVSITYENLIEDEAFGAENTGRSKQKESLVGLVKALDIFKKKYGEVIVNFGEPLHLSKFLASRHLNGSGTSRARTEERTFAQDFGQTIVRAIRDTIHPSLTSLTYTALMLTPQYGLSRSNLITAIKSLASYIMLLRKHKLCVCEFTPSLERFLDGREYILNDIARGGAVHVETCIDELIFFIPGKKRFTADFYRNSSMHFFFHLGLFSLLEVMQAPLTAESTLPFHRLFEHDFILPSQSDFFSECSKYLAVLEQEHLLMRVGGELHFHDHSYGSFAPGLLHSSIESLLWVMYNLKNNTSLLEEDEESKRDGLKSFSFPKFMASLQQQFKVATYRSMMTRTEAASRTSLMAALESLHARQVITLQDTSGQRSRIVLKQDMSEDIAILERAQSALKRWEEVSKVPTDTAHPLSLLS